MAKNQDKGFTPPRKPGENCCFLTKGVCFLILALLLIVVITAQSGRIESQNNAGRDHHKYIPPEIVSGINTAFIMNGL